jgi:alpha-tubulin suppressor-like RCC1 family protein
MPIGARAYVAISTRTQDTARGDGNFVCGIRDTDQKIECWGPASRGQTGAADPTVPTTLPNEVPNLAGCTAVATGVEHACAICAGTVSCWGDNRSGQLAAQPDDLIASVPRTIDIPLAGDPWVQLVAGSRFTCARSTAGRVFCWGLSEHGALGIGATGANLPMIVLASQID